MDRTGGYQIAPDDTVSVSLKDHIELIELAVLILGHASNSIFQILKSLINSLKKVKDVLK